MIPIFAYAAIPEAITSVHAQRHDLHFDLSVQNTPAIVDAVLLQQIDLGVICPTQHYEGIHTLFATRVPYQCLLPESHPLATSQQDIDLAELLDDEFVMLYPGYMEQEFEDEDLTIALRRNTRIVARSDLAIAGVARSTGLPTLVDPYSARIAVARE